MTKEHLSCSLILATYKEKVDKLNLVEVANHFCFENEHRFSFKNIYFCRKFTESVSTTGDANKSCCSVETRTC